MECVRWEGKLVEENGWRRVRWEVRWWKVSWKQKIKGGRSSARKDRTQRKKFGKTKRQWERKSEFSEQKNKEEIFEEEGKSKGTEGEREFF